MGGCHPKGAVWVQGKRTRPDSVHRDEVHRYNKQEREREGERVRQKERGRGEGRRGGREGRGGEGRKHLAIIWSLKESACLSLTLPFDECLRKAFAAEPLGHSAFFLPSFLFDGKAIILLPPKKSPYNTTGLPIICKSICNHPLARKEPRTLGVCDGNWTFRMSRVATRNPQSACRACSPWDHCPSPCWLWEPAVWTC